MKLFHGTTQRNIDSIRESGLETPPLEEWSLTWWSREVGLPPSVFLCNQPKASPGSSPVEFAHAEDDDGYLVVVELPQPDFTERLRGIWTTHDIDQYYDARFDIDDYCLECLGRNSSGEYSAADSRRVLSWLRDKHPTVARQFHIRDGWICSDPDWLLMRRRDSLAADCQAAMASIPASYIRSLIKVYDGRSERILPAFDPKLQSKRKHKRKSFAGLVWHHLNSNKKR